MDRYPGFVRYFVICLVAVYTLADGHLLCAPCLASSENHCVEHCDLLHRQTQEVFTSPSCCSEDHNGRPLCNGNDLSAIVAQCCTEELVKLLEWHITDCTFAVHAKCRQVVLIDVETYYPSALSLRLHLLYGVLVI